MVILGIDPGIRYAGFGLMKKDGHRIALTDFGFLKMPPAYPLHERVGMFYDFFSEKIKAHQVTHIALETPFLGRNAQNFLKLGYVRGILYLLASQQKLALCEFAPTQVKQAITGFGGAQKEQVSRVILQLFPGIKTVDRFDVTDAIAVTLCGIWSTKRH